jgi:hypothetical protein
VGALAAGAFVCAIAPGDSITRAFEELEVLGKGTAALTGTLEEAVAEILAGAISGATMMFSSSSLAKKDERSSAQSLHSCKRDSNPQG